MKLILEFILFACVSSASVLPLDPTSASVWRERLGNNFAFGAHESHGLPIPVPAHPDHVGMFAAKTVPESISPVNYVGPAGPLAAGYVRPVPYSFGAHSPIVHNPQMGLHEGAPLPYSGFRYPVIGMQQNVRMH